MNILLPYQAKLCPITLAFHISLWFVSLLTLVLYHFSLTTTPGLALSQLQLDPWVHPGLTNTCIQKGRACPTRAVLLEHQSRLEAPLHLWQHPSTDLFPTPLLFCFSNYHMLYPLYISLW